VLRISFLLFFIFYKVAGGLGERLGYNGIKIRLPIDLITKTSFLEYYILFIKEYSKRACIKQIHIIPPSTLESQLPFVIMTSPLTHKKTLEYLESNSYFGMKNETTILQ